MPRMIRRLLVVPVALAALTLASCFNDVGDCPTCPGVSSGRLNVVVPKFGLVDSVQIRVDGGAQVTVKRDRSYTFEGLSEGSHEVRYTRWYFIDDLVSSRSATFEIRLERGETRTIVFHNDFPLIGWAPPSGAGVRHGPVPPRVA